MTYKNDIKTIDKLIFQARGILSMLERSEKRIGNKADFTLTGLVGRNAVGDFIRNSKVLTINSDIGRLQSELLDFHKNLMLFDEDLAAKVDLPVKLEEFRTARTAISDIKLRTQMRSKKLEVAKIQVKMKTIIKKLIKEKEKISYNIKKEEELETFKKI